MTYQWARNGNNISGANNSTYSAIGAGFYSVTVTNSNGCFTISNAVSVIQVSAPNTPVLSSISSNICPGDSLQINASPSSSLLTYLWFKDGQPVSGPFGVGVTGLAGSTFRTGEPGNYTVQTRTNNGCIIAISNSVSFVLLSNTVPVISQQPVNNTVNIGDTANFSVIASNFDTITWQYRPTNSNLWFPVVSGGGNPYLQTNTTQLKIIAHSPFS